MVDRPELAGAAAFEWRMIEEGDEKKDPRFEIDWRDSLESVNEEPGDGRGTCRQDTGVKERDEGWAGRSIVGEGERTSMDDRAA